MPDHCWVLLRDDMTWHRLAQSCLSKLGFFGRPALCGIVTPINRLDVISFSHQQPGMYQDTRKPVLCSPCFVLDRKVAVAA